MNNGRRICRLVDVPSVNNIIFSDSVFVTSGGVVSQATPNTIFSNVNLQVATLIVGNTSTPISSTISVTAEACGSIFISLRSYFEQCYSSRDTGNILGAIMITPNTRKGMGWWPDLPDFRDHKMSLKKKKLFHDVDFRSSMPPIYDQEQTSGCVAHGIAAAIQHRRKIENLPDFEPSRLFIYANARIIENELNKDDGCEIRDGIKAVASSGAPDEKYWPFDISKLLLKPSDEAYKMGLTDLVSEYQSVDVNEISMLTALDAGYPVIFGISLYDSFDRTPWLATVLFPCLPRVKGLSADIYADCWSKDRGKKIHREK